MTDDKSNQVQQPDSERIADERNPRLRPQFRKIVGHLLPRGADAESPLLGTDDVAQQIGITCRQLGLDNADVERVRRLHARWRESDDSADAIAQVLSEPALAPHADGDTDLDQLAFSLRQFFDWFAELDNASEECLRQRVDFYLRHRILGVSTSWYLIAYELYLKELTSLAFKSNAGLLDTPDHCADLDSLHRVMLLDLGLLQQAYLFTRGRRNGEAGDYLFPARRRKDFIDHVNKSLAAHGGSVAVIALMIDNLHQINTLMGHQVGDLVMQHVATRLSESLREEDYLQRTGASEFAIQISGLQGKQVALLAANKFTTILSDPVHTGGRELHLSSATGVAVAPEHGHDGAAVFQHAELAMREAARLQIDCVMFNKGLQERSREVYGLETELRRAITEKDELYLHYQPQVDLTTGKIVGCEALLRWNNPKYGTVSPAKFVPIAEKSGLIHRLSVWVLQNAVREFAQGWMHPNGGTLSVNLSAMNLLDPDVPELVKRVLATWDVAPECLVLEITESAVMEKPRAALKSLQELSDIGVKLAIDDFGTGHSSLIYLKRLPVFELKIDRSFVMNMTHEASDERIVRTVIDLAHNFGLEVTAEGVEDQETRARLAELGCERMQGYLTSRPIAATDYMRLLQKHP